MNLTSENFLQSIENELARLHGIEFKHKMLVSITQQWLRGDIDTNTYKTCLKILDIK